MALDKPSDHEGEYFAKVDAEKRKKLRTQQDTKRKEEAKEKAKNTHWMKCPKCGSDLEEIVKQDVAIDQCTECDGIWLDKGELELLCDTGERGSILGRIFRK